MNIDKLSTIVALIMALSVASERLVEIIKGFFKDLDKENPDPEKEARRRSYLQILAVCSGILTAFLAQSAIPDDIHKPGDHLSILALGLLASGGSGLWNSVLTYFGKVKDIKKLEVEDKKKG